MKDNVVLWTCKLCGNNWRGKSPKFRATRPHCSRCGSWFVRVKDWLIDSERWKKARLDALERADWQCQACRQRLDTSAPVHHLDYSDYYNPDNLVCLCPHCHFLIHGKAPSYILGKVSMIFGIISIILGVLGINEVRISQTSISQATVVLAFIGLLFGLGLILLALWLTKETRKVRGMVKELLRSGRNSTFAAGFKMGVKKVIKKQPKHQEAISSIESEVTGAQINGIFYCQQCLREISEQEFEEFGGLCRQCRGMPSQKGFPAPPGFPKL
ncbi:MAG: HNH endonuclease signature motif containing protein [Nitrospirota bacterium]